mgnify:CR=1 FL=1
MDETVATTRGVRPPAFALLYMAWGLCSGFLTIALGYELAQAGVSVAAIAGLVGLFLFPQSAKLLIGPVIDVSLTVKRWYWLATFATLAGLAGIAFTPLVPASMPLLSALSLLLGIANVSANDGAAVLAEGQAGSVAAWTTERRAGRPNSLDAILTREPPRWKWGSWKSWARFTTMNLRSGPLQTLR